MSFDPVEAYRGANLQRAVDDGLASFGVGAPAMWCHGQQVGAVLRVFEIQFEFQRFAMAQAHAVRNERQVLGVIVIADFIVQPLAKLEQKGLTGVLVDDRKRAVRCIAEEQGQTP